MQQLLFVTGNSVKFNTAQHICNEFGIALERADIDLPEIQSADGEVVARDKARQAYQQLQRPLIVTDDTWLIPGLKNFPGPLMKFINAAFTSEDWLRLTEPLTDRRIILRQIVVYRDADQQHSFYTDVEGILLKKIRGRHPYSHNAIVSFNGGRTTIAEEIKQGTSALDAAQHDTSWHKFGKWFTARPSTL